MKGRPVTVIVLSWNSAPVVEEAVASALGQTAPGVDVALVDNASSDGSADNVESRFGERVRIVRHGENLGYTGGYNAALGGIVAGERAGDAEAPEFVLLLNPDVRLEPDYLENAFAAFDDPRVGMVSGRLLREERDVVDSTGQFLARSRKTIDRGYGAPSSEAPPAKGRVLSVCGAAALYRVAMLRDIADAGEVRARDYFAFNEDLELGWRAWRAGWRAVHEPRAVAVHLRASGDEGGTFGLTFKRPPHVTAHIVKNRWLAMLRHDRPSSVLRDLPWIAARDLALALVVTVTRPSVWREIWRARGAFGRALAQRRADRNRSGAWGAWRRDVPPRGVWGRAV